MQKQNAPVHAAVDIGSNTIHLVVARSKPDDLDILADELELVRIGESVTATGKISQQKLRATINVLCRYKSLAEQHGAEVDTWQASASRSGPRSACSATG